MFSCAIISLWEKTYEKKSRIYVEPIGIRVERDLKEKIDKLKGTKDVPEIIRDAIREAIERHYEELIFAPKAD
jgi:hypothetical protein